MARPPRDAAALARCTLAGVTLAALLAGAPVIAAEAVSDQLGPALGVARAAASAAAASTRQATPQSAALEARLYVQAGQARLLRDGVAALAPPKAPAPLAFRLKSKPSCGTAIATSQGIVLRAGEECAGKRIAFGYEVVWQNDPGSPVGVEVVALGQPGVTSCGIKSSPFVFAAIPAGTYAVSSAPASLADLARIAGKATVVTPEFCISLEPVSEQELQAFDADRPRDASQAATADAQFASTQPLARNPASVAVGVSHVTAAAFAAEQTRKLERQVTLPSIDHYLAAAIHLSRKEPQAPATQTFLLSIRSGPIEWLAGECASPDARAALGPRKRTGEFELFCYEQRQRMSRIAFRLVVNGSAK